MEPQSQSEDLQPQAMPHPLAEQAHPQVQPQSAQTESQPQEALNLNSPYMRRVMKESAGQLAEKLQEFLDHNERSYFTHSQDITTPARSLTRAIEPSLKNGFNATYDEWWQALAAYFSQAKFCVNNNPMQFGSLKTNADNLSRTETVKIIKLRIGWLINISDSFLIKY